MNTPKRQSRQRHSQVFTPTNQTDTRRAGVSTYALDSSKRFLEKFTPMHSQQSWMTPKRSHQAEGQSSSRKQELKAATVSHKIGTRLMGNKKNASQLIFYPQQTRAADEVSEKREGKPRV